MLEIKSDRIEVFTKLYCQGQAHIAQAHYANTTFTHVEHDPGDPPKASRYSLQKTQVVAASLQRIDEWPLAVKSNTPLGPLSDLPRGDAIFPSTCIASK